MAKKRALCPDCGHKFTIQTDGLKLQSVGVRSRRVTGNQFDYTMTTPAHMIEAGQFGTATDDLILSGAFSLPVGAAFGLAASIAAPDYAIELIGLGASIGASVAWGWLCAEYNQRLKSILPWFLEQSASWSMAKDEEIGGNVELTMNHRYRDGHSEAGRTIQYFGVLPVDTERFSEWTAAVLGTRVPAQTLAIANWTGSKGLFSRGEYESLLSLLREAGVAIKEPGKGHNLTNGGRRVLGYHLKAHPPAPVQERA